MLVGLERCIAQMSTNMNQTVKTSNQIINLPVPRYDGSMSVEKALHKRRSVREFLKAPLTLAEISQLLWAAQGITYPEGLRTTPSAGALYPLEIYLVVGNITDVTPSVYKYFSKSHEMRKVIAGDIRQKLSEASLGQESIRNAACIVIFTANYERTRWKYGERGIRYTHIEVGHASENVFLQAVALDIKSVVIGAFSDGKVKDLLRLPDEEDPIYIMPLGK
jgi:SagB-type dehydrogenase family enzyme